MPKNVGDEPVVRRKMVVVRVWPHWSPETSGPQYEQYCQQKVVLTHAFPRVPAAQSWMWHAEAFAVYLQSGSIPPSLEDDLYWLQQQQQQNPGESDSDCEEISDEQSQHNQAREEWWMLLCSNLQQSSEETQQSTDWTAAAQLYPNLEEAPHFVTCAKENAQLQVPASTAA